MKAGNFIEMWGEDNYKKVDLKTYQRLIDKLVYLFYSNRPDITFVIGQLSKQNTDPRVRHLKAAKRVVLYLMGTMYLGLTYGTHPKSEKKEKVKTKAPVS